MHASALAFAQRHVHGPARRVIELGSLDINGSPRPLFDGCDYTGVDLQAGPGVDVVADIHDVSLEPADVVVCMEVLEHAADPAGIVARCWDLLVAGGHLILTAATDPRAPHSAIDEAPIRSWEHYRNVDLAELDGWLEPFDVCEIDTGAIGDVYVCARRPHRG